MEVFMSICLGVGLSAATGFRVFIPALLANVAAMNGIITPAEGFAWLASWPAFVVLVTASIAEVASYYIPFIDNLLDTIATPVSVVAGTLLTTSFLHIESDVLQWTLGIIAGGGTAGVVQSATGLLRLFSLKTTAGLGNPVVATTENVAAFGFSGLAVFLPVLTFVLVVALLIGIVIRIRKLRRNR